MSRKTKTILCAAFGVYCTVMLYLLFGQRFGRVAPLIPQRELFRNNVNLIPFLTIREFIHTANSSSIPYLIRHAFINLVGNVLMFVPLGFFPPFIWERLGSFGRCMLYAMVCIVFIELIQFITLLGSCDVDDLILNMIGVAIGYGLHRLFRPLLQHRSGRYEHLS